MPWDNSDYPDSFKNLEPEIRRKAIVIANALLREGYEESRAISISMTKAREYVHGTDDKRPHYEVKPHNEDWVLMKADGEKPFLRSRRKRIYWTKQSLTLTTKMVFYPSIMRTAHSSKLCISEKRNSGSSGVTLFERRPFLAIQPISSYGC